MVRCGLVRFGRVRFGAVRYGPVRKMQRNEIYLTSLERKVKSFLDERGIVYIPQYPLRQGYIADFALPDRKIIIEVDGERWHSGKKKLKKDRFRDYMLKRAGWTTIRIKEKDINKIPKLLSSVVDEFG